MREHTMVTDDIYEYYPEVIKEVKNKPITYDNTERVLLIDADSIAFTATYFPDDTFPTVELQIEEAKFRTRTKLQEIQNNIEECFNIKKTFIFISGKNNFRYAIFPEYKAKRKLLPINPLVIIIKQYMLQEYEAIPSHNAEADDYVIEAMKMSNYNCVIATIDKDVIYHAPNIPIYNYRSHNDTLGEFKFITKNQSRLSIASQICTGDPGDGVPGAKGIGESWCKKNLHEGMSDYQFVKNIFLAYLKANKGDVIEAKKQMKLYYKVLKLHTQEEIKTLLSKEK